MKKMDDDKDGRASLSDFREMVRILIKLDEIETIWTKENGKYDQVGQPQVQKEPLLMEAFGKMLPHHIHSDQYH